MARHIGRDARDALYHAVRGDLRFIGAIAEALDESRYRTAEILGARYRAELRMLEDLGWGPDEPRARFELTLPDAQLARSLLRLLNHTTREALDRPHRTGEDDDPEWTALVARNQTLVSVCGELLQDVSPDIVASAGEPLPEEWPAR